VFEEYTLYYFYLNENPPQVWLVFNNEQIKHRVFDVENWKNCYDQTTNIGIDINIDENNNNSILSGNNISPNSIRTYMVNINNIYTRYETGEILPVLLGRYTILFWRPDEIIPQLWLVDCLNRVKHRVNFFNNPIRRKIKNERFNDNKISPFTSKSSIGNKFYSQQGRSYLQNYEY
jgi:hypothetical protein